MKFPAKYTLALQILCISHTYQDKKITSSFISDHTGADPSLIRLTMLDLKKKDLVVSKPGPGGTTLNCDLSKVSLYDVYELVADTSESPLKITTLPESASSTDEAINIAANSVFNELKEKLFSEMKTVSVLDICDRIDYNNT